MLDLKEKNLSTTTFIDLFAGLGGFRLALESLGSACVFSSEWDKRAQDVYESNFSERPNGDITKIDEKDVPDHDILCAGFPCQAFSISGNKLGFEDSRGTLFFDVARIVKEKKPKVVFLENVKNFATHDHGNTLRVVRSTLEEMGYTFHSKVLNAADFGVPQKRERIYIVAFRQDVSFASFSFPQPKPLKTFVEDILLDDPEETMSLICTRKDIELTRKDISDNQSKSVRLGIVNKGGQGERIYSSKGVAVTLSAYGGGVFAKTGGYWISGSARKLHPRECARLMGFPDEYQLSKSDSQSYKQFGNSVVVDVLQLVAFEIGKTLAGQSDLRY
jgi:DNA (cytosine-5)-methyltransferase 1